MVSEASRQEGLRYVIEAGHGFIRLARFGFTAYVCIQATSNDIALLPPLSVAWSPIEGDGMVWGILK